MIHMKEGETMSATAKNRETGEQVEARRRLQGWLSPGDTVYTVIRSVAKSGMSRRLDLYRLEQDEPLCLTGNVAILCDLTFPRHGEGLRVDGCGMDMGFNTVYNLAATLWPDGFGCIGEGCSSNDHSNGDRDYTQQGMMTCEGPTVHWHQNGGYALRQRWL